MPRVAWDLLAVEDELLDCLAHLADLVAQLGPVHVRPLGNLLCDLLVQLIQLVELRELTLRFVELWIRLMR